MVAVRRVVAPAPQPEIANHLKARRVVSASCDVTRGVGDTWATGPMLPKVFGAEEKGFVVEVNFQLMFSFLFVKMEGCRHRFCSAEL